MTIREATNQAIDTDNAKAAGRIVEFLRDKGFRYKDCVAFFQRERPKFTESDFEDLIGDDAVALLVAHDAASISSLRPIRGQEPSSASTRVLGTPGTLVPFG